MYNWPLNVNNFTLFDRLKICKFFLEDNHWTQDKYVREYEKEMAKFVGADYAVFVSSGSTANTILAMYLRDIVAKENPHKTTIIVPSTTWLTSVSVFIREGFHPKFIDISLKDFSMDLEQLEDFLIGNSDEVACVFITSLLGFVPDITKLKKLGEKYKIKIMLDACEATLSNYGDNFQHNVSSYFTSTTSTYFGHCLNSAGEGGFVFTNDAKEYEYFLMARNHGMVRSLENPEEYRNKKVDARFDFAILGNNFRNTEISAFAGLLDLKRANEYTVKRRSLYYCFRLQLNPDKYLLPEGRIACDDIAFSLPIILKGKDKLKKLEKAKEICEQFSIETRPIVGQNLLHQTPFQGYGRPKDFPNSEYLHNYGFYVGLYSKLKKEDITNLANSLNLL